MSRGMIGIGKMGSNLSKNILNKKHKLHIHDKSEKVIKRFIYNNKNKVILKHHYTIDEMIKNMDCPRTIMMMLPSGETTDNITLQLIELLSENDTIIDLSNEYYEESERRGETCKMKNINYLGAGISGGCNGALLGPCLMIGGNKEVYENHKEFLDSISKNVVHVNEDYSSGHYCKMVHNGIEYAMLQTIADVFAYCNQDMYIMLNAMKGCIETDIDGYIIKESFKIMHNYPEMQNIMDIGVMNDTGKWCVQEMLLNNIVSSTISSAVQSRLMSRSRTQGATRKINKKMNLDIICNVIRFAFAQSIKEGLQIISKQENMDVNKAIEAWSKGTIIECKMIEKSEEELNHILKECENDTREFVKQCVESKISVPVVQNALMQYDYNDEMHTSMCIVMAYRNHFGGHEIKLNSIL